MKLVKRFNFLCALSIGITIGYFMFSEDIEAIDTYNYYEKNYLTKMGSTLILNDETDWISYELRSFDGGKIWYAVRSDISDGSVHILGVSDSIYPGLIDHIEGLDKLYDYIENNGSIDLSGEDSLGQLKLL